MGFKCGIVGLPNVGKSTLFNALTRTAAAQAENYPFCTIDPNIGEVGVPDPRLTTIAEIGGSAKIIQTRLTFVDIAGLVRGASKGEGLGNKFLANIREVDAIAHVLRCFDDGDVTHVEGRIDPVSDAETINTELMLADLESLEKRAEALIKKARGNDRKAKETLELVDLALGVLRAGRPARDAEIPDDKRNAFNRLNLLSSKPVLYVCNVEEDAAATGNEYSRAVEAMARGEGAAFVVICANIEAELSLLEEDDQREYLKTLGLESSGLDRLIRAGYELLDLITFFTVGPKEARAWTVTKGARAAKAAGAIHTDFERGFIRAQTIEFGDFLACKGEQGAKDAGKARDEGKEYLVKDGDIILFKFAV